MAELFAGLRDRTDAPALIDERGETSWRDLDDRVNRLIHVIRSHGIQPGERVALLSGNRREIFEVFAAVAHCGMVVVPVNWHFAPEEVAYVVDNSGSRLLIVEPDHLPGAAEVDSEVPRLVFDSSYEEALAAADPAEPEDQMMGAVMFYTSGTTGRPKGVTSSSFTAGVSPSVYSLIAAGMGQLGVPPQGRTLLCGPGYHSAQWALSFFPFIGGSTVVIQRRFDPAGVLELIDRHEVTNVHLVPTQFVRLLRLPEERRAAFSGRSLTLVLHGAAPCSPDVKRQMIQWWGPKITEYYGATESGFLSLIGSEEWLERPGSVGRPLPNMEVRIVADDGSDAEAAQPGVIHARNASGADFEYLGEPEKTAQAHSLAGYFTLGDIGYLDADGYLYLSDRRIDMIISGGVNIYPAEIEGVLTAHPAVVDAAVFGIPDEEYGEKVHATVQLAAGAVWDEAAQADVEAYLRGRLAGYKVPRDWAVVDEMPRSEAGKLLKPRLRAPYWEHTGRSI
jgi:long-chain acyl-CoA synthetase